MMAGRRATGRAVWLALVLPPLAAWAVLAILASGYNTPQQQTGDALLDRYCAALLECRLPKKLSSHGDVRPNMTLDANLLGSWESDFGRDPRYWMLRYYNAGLISFPLEAADSILVSHPEELPAVRQRISYLEEARKRGIADGPILLTLLRWQEAIWIATEYEPADRPLNRKQIRPSELAQFGRETIDANHAAEEAELLQELQAAAPEEACPHYYAALNASQRGDYETAIAELARGNRKPRHSRLGGFPSDDLLRRMRNGEPLPDSIAGCLIWLNAQNVSYSGYAAFQRLSRVLLQTAAERQDLAALAEMHAFGVLFGDDEHGGIVGALLGLDVLSLTWLTASQQWPVPLSTEQRQSLTELRHKIDQLESEMSQSLSATSWPAKPPALGQRPPLEAAKQLLSDGRSDSVESLDKLYSAALSDQQALGGRIHELFQEIARFDYNTLSWREE
jgi:hypothetical protein